jgi:hypothetical protein
MDSPYFCSLGGALSNIQQLGIIITAIVKVCDNVIIHHRSTAFGYCPMLESKSNFHIFKDELCLWLKVKKARKLRKSCERNQKATAATTTVMMTTGSWKDIFVSIFLESSS